MADYSVSEAFQQIEENLINSMIRNMSRHIDTEHAEGLNYTQWQAEQLKSLAEYRSANKAAFSDYFSTINTKLEEALRKAEQTGETEQEASILKALKGGFKPRRAANSDSLSGEFFKINDRKLNAYITAVKRDMKKAETAMLRMADDRYRKAIFNAGVAYNTGAYTLPQAIDSATRDFLNKGLDCVEYKNGRRVSADTYAEMALRTSSTRCYLMGESAKRDEWGINTVIVNKRGTACPKCLKYVGKVFYDDVYGNIKPTDDKYPRLSSAIAGGLYHPNCRDIHTTWFEGVSEPPEEMTDDEKKKAEETYKLEQRQRYNERQIRRYKRLSEGALDEQEKAKYTEHLKQWQKRNAVFVEEHGDVLRRRYDREKIRGIDVKLPKPPKVSWESEKALTNGDNGGIIKSGSGTVMEKEFEYGVRYGSLSIDADLDYINSETYASKFGKITDNEAVNKSLAKCSKEAINHRTGTLYEDMYLINGNTGEIMGSQINAAYEQGIDYNESIRNALAAAKRDDIPIIAFHSHPEGYPPSVDDFNSAYNNNYALGVVSGHNGQIYVYNKPESAIEFADAIQEEIAIRYHGGVDVDRAYKEAYELVGIDYGIVEEVNL